MDNIFYDIPNYEGFYQINKNGVVKSLSRNVVYNDNKTRHNKERYLKYHYNKKGYVCYDLYKNSVKKRIYGHQLMAITFLTHTQCGMSIVVNHINSIRDDNRLSNLEIVSTRENCQNKKVKKTSKYTGVCWCKKMKKWRSNIRINGIQTSLGYFEDEIEAKKAYTIRLNELLKK